MTLSSLGNALIFAIVGVVVYACGFVLIGRSLPGNLWRKALQDNELSAAVVLAAVALGLAWIVAAAVH